MKSKLKQLRILGNNERVKRNINSRQEIEQVLARFNYSYYSKAKDSKACKDRMHPRMHSNDMRDRVLKGVLSEENIDYSDVYRVLKLLKVPKGQELETKSFTPIIEVK